MSTLQRISFVTILKNRTNITVDVNDTTRTLTLFENNLRSLIQLIQPTDIWEYIIVDFESTDVDISTFVETLPKCENLTFRIYTLKETFDKGRGLNFASNLPNYNTVFFLDADMMIRTRAVFDDIQTYVVEQNRVLFPICWSYSNPEHTSGTKRDTGVGNVVQQKQTIIQYAHNTSWGMEDTLNFQHYTKTRQAIRTYYSEGFVHQWHPRYISHMYYPVKK